MYCDLLSAGISEHILTAQGQYAPSKIGPCLFVFDWLEMTTFDYFVAALVQSDIGLGTG